MSRAALYQKYRSKDFEEVVGQEYVVRSIRNAIRDRKVGHAYLFCGPRGTGKTTMARLLAKAVNCENPDQAPCGTCPSCIAAAEGTHPDIVEMNAANETHVEDIRDLIDRARLAPMLGEHKIYIIDEVHQLSSSAASALLKTLEEPPSHVIFILATTDPQKLLPTIVSRCQRFDFSKVERNKIRDHLISIAGKEGYSLEEEAAAKIAELADGGMRDALSILEQTVSYSQGNITEDDINQIYGLASTSQKIAMIHDIKNGDVASVIRNIRAYEQRGIDLERLNRELIEVIRDAAVYRSTKKETLLRTLNAEQAGIVASELTSKEMVRMMEELMKALDTYRYSQSAAASFEVVCLNMMLGNDDTAAEPVRKPEKKEIPAPASQPPEAAETPAAEPEPAAVPEPLINKVTETRLRPDTGEILNLLLQSSKNEKAADMAKLGPAMSGSDMNRYLNNLRSTAVAASGENCILFVSQLTAIVNRINDPEYNKELYGYLKDTFRIDKVPFAADKETYDSAVNEFIRRRKEGTLPAVRKIEKYSSPAAENKDDEPDTEQKLIQLFGKDMVEII